CLSASHIAYGSIRMEPVFMVLGQSAATAAGLAINGRVALQDIDIRKLQEKLREDGQILEWTGGAPAAGGPRAPLVDPKSLKGIVLDDADGRKTGAWLPSSRAGDRKVGTGYIHDGNANKGDVSIAFTPEIPREGEYEIILLFPPNENRATNVPVTVTIEG